MTAIVCCYVPAAARAAAEAAAEPYLRDPLARNTTPGGHELAVELNATGSDADPVTHWGCTAADPTGQFAAAAPALATAFGGGYRVVTDYRDFDPNTHWRGWLLTHGLRPVRPATI